MKKDNATLLKKLQQYSALAVPVLASAGNLDAQVVYHDLDPDVVLSSPGDSLLIDLNNDGIFDYTFRLVAYTTSWNRVIVAPANKAGVYTTADKNAMIGYLSTKSSGTIYPYASALPLGHVIDDNQPMFVFHDLLFAASGNTYYYFPVMNSIFATAQYGQWKDGAEHFTGFKFTPDDGSTFYFGWARCVVAADAKSITIKDYAYESQPGTGMVAGEGTNIGIGTPGDDMGVKIFESNRSLHVNFEAGNFSDATLRLLNILGEEIMNQKVIASQNTIALNQLSSGVYLVEVNLNGKEVSKKIVIK